MGTEDTFKASCMPARVLMHSKANVNAVADLIAQHGQERLVGNLSGAATTRASGLGTAKHSLVVHSRTHRFQRNQRKEPNHGRPAIHHLRVVHKACVAGCTR